MDEIITIIDFYDLPRSGIATFRGEPHYYECEFDKCADDYTDIYLLSPVSTEVLNKAREGWEIWKRWQRAFHLGKVGLDSHPALPEDRDRHEVIDKELKQLLKIDQGNAATVSATFHEESIHGKGHDERYLVEWIPA